MMDRTTGAPGAHRRTTWYGAFVALCALLLGGCAGGSGSSGFDIVAAENAAIDTALDTGDCVVEHGLTICASGTVASPVVPSATPTATVEPAASLTATVAGSPTPTPTSVFPTAATTRPPFSATPTRTSTRAPEASPAPTVMPAQPRVESEADATDVANCVLVAAAQSCTLRVVFVSMGIPDDAVYRAAVRARSPDSTWRVLPVADGAFTVEVPPEVTVVQTAVLVFERDPGPLPDEVEVLSDTGAELAFVSAPRAVR
jgi:hypothetical protein